MKLRAKLASLIAAVLMGGCATPEGVGTWEYLWGATSYEREATLVCLRYPEYYPNCDVAKLRTLAEAASGFDQDCKAFTERATEIAQDWGFEDVGYVFVPGDQVNPGHVALLITTKDGKYIVDNGAADGPMFSRTGTLDEFSRAMGRPVVEIPRAFAGREARKFDNGGNVLTAVLDADMELTGY